MSALICEAIPFKLHDAITTPCMRRSFAEPVAYFVDFSSSLKYRNFKRKARSWNINFLGHQFILLETLSIARYICLGIVSIKIRRNCAYSMGLGDQHWFYLYVHFNLMHFIYFKSWESHSATRGNKSSNWASLLYLEILPLFFCLIFFVECGKNFSL